MFIEGSTPIVIVIEGSQWKGREAKGGRGRRCEPVMVPETVVPFLSSIVTDSLFNFICSCTTFEYQSRKGREIREVREKRTRNLNRFKVVRANSNKEGGQHGCSMGGEYALPVNPLLVSDSDEMGITFLYPSRILPTRRYPAEYVPLLLSISLYLSLAPFHGVCGV